MTGERRTVGGVPETVAIVAIVGGFATTAITVVSGHIAAARRARAEAEQLDRKFVQERGMRDILEVRSILDDAGRAMRIVRNTADRPKSAGWVEQAKDALEPLEARLLIRLPCDDATRAVTGVLDALRGIDMHYAINAGAIHSEEDEDEFWDGLTTLRDEVTYQANSFFEAASLVVGAQLVLPED